MRRALLALAVADRLSWAGLVNGACLPRGTCANIISAAADYCGTLGPDFVTCGPLLRGTCAIEEGTFAVRGKTAVTLAEAKYHDGSGLVACNLTGALDAHPYGYYFDNIKGALRPANLFHSVDESISVVADSPEMLEFPASELGMATDADGKWGFGLGGFTVTGWLRPGFMFGIGVQDVEKNWTTFFSKADPGPGRTQYGTFASLYRTSPNFLQGWDGKPAWDASPYQTPQQSTTTIRFGVEDNAERRLEVTCEAWGCDSCLPRSVCGDAGDRQVRKEGDPCTMVLGADFVSCSPIQTGKWVMLTFVRDRNVLRAYINGKLSGEKTVPVVDVSNAGNLRVGAHPVFQTGMNLDGFLDDFRVYDYALRETEVAALLEDTWKLHCDVVVPDHAMPGSCAVPTEFNPGGVLRPADGLLAASNWCAFACEFGHKLMGNRPYCNYGFNLGNNTCELVEVGKNCTDPLAENFVRPSATCWRGPPLGNGSGAIEECNGNCVPRGSCDVEDLSAVAGVCEVLSVYSEYDSKTDCRGFVLPHGQECTDTWATEHGCTKEPTGNFWRADECVISAQYGMPTNHSDIVVGPTDEEQCEFMSSGYSWSPQPTLTDDGSCNYTCGLYGNFGTLTMNEVNVACEAEYNECMGCALLGPSGLFERCEQAEANAAAILAAAQADALHAAEQAEAMRAAAAVSVFAAEEVQRQTKANAGVEAQYYASRVQAEADAAATVVAAQAYASRVAEEAETMLAVAAASVLAAEEEYRRLNNSGSCVPIGTCDISAKSCAVELAEALTSDVFPKAGSSQLMAVLECVKAKEFSDLTQCMIYDHNPWVWNEASSGLIQVRADMEFLLQGSSNTAEYEGRIQVEGGTLVARHVISRGQNARNGGAISIWGGFLTLENSLLEQNVAFSVATDNHTSGRGGAIWASGTTMTIRSCRFESNRAADVGGALYFDASTTATIATSVFIDNAAGAQGGAVACSFCTLSLTSTILRENSAGLINATKLKGQRRLAAADYFSGSGVGGAVFLRGAVFRATDVTIMSNTATAAGAGIYMTAGTAGLERVSIQSNLATGAFNSSTNLTSSAGGGVYAAEAVLKMDACLVSENNASLGPELYLLELPDGWFIRDTPIGSNVSSYNPDSSHGSVLAVGLSPAACQRHPCGKGYGCSYLNYSLVCTRCHRALFSDDGLTCKRAPPREGAGADGLVIGSYPLNTPHQEESAQCNAALQSPFGVCLPCPRGKQADSSGLSCDECPIGQYSSDGDSCRACVPSFEPNDVLAATDCLPCIVGTYSANGTKCIECPDGFVATDKRTGCTEVDSCLVTDWYPGVFSADGGKTCHPCPDGKEAMVDESGCNECSSNAVSPLGVSCRVCPPGMQPNDGRVTLFGEVEWRSTHQTVSQTDCISCEEVSLAAYSSAGNRCDACPIGKKPNWNRTACDDCKATDQWLPGECIQCPAGKRPNLGGGQGRNTVCEQCPTGFAGVDGICEQCPDGKEPNIGHVYTPAAPADCSNGGSSSSVAACEYTGQTYTASTCWTATNDPVLLAANSKIECMEACDFTGNTYTHPTCTNGGDPFSFESCERTGNTFTEAEEAECSNDGDATSKFYCEETGNTFIYLEIGDTRLCTNGGDPTSQETCKLTGNVFTPATPNICTNGGNNSSLEACEVTGNTWTPGSCSNGGGCGDCKYDASSEKICEQICEAKANVWTEATCQTCTLIEDAAARTEDGCSLIRGSWLESTWSVGQIERQKGASCQSVTDPIYWMGGKGKYAGSMTGCERTGDTYARTPYADWYTRGMWTDPTCNGDNSSIEACDDFNTYSAYRDYSDEYSASVWHGSPYGIIQPAKCLNNRTASREQCESTGNVYTPGACYSCFTAGNVSSRASCEITGNVYTPATPPVCSNGGDASSPEVCMQAKQSRCASCKPGRVGTSGFCEACWPSSASDANGVLNAEYQSFLTPTELLDYESEEVCENCANCVPTSVCPDLVSLDGHTDSCTILGANLVSCSVYSLGIPRTQCHSCDAGQYSLDGVRCRRCEPGYQVNSDQSGCTACELGKYSPDVSDCVYCTVGYEMNAVIAATGCISCLLRGPGFYSADAIWCKQCNPGTRPNTDLSECRPCPNQMFGSPGNCSLCPSGKQPNLARTGCTLCVSTHAGTFGRCDRCEDGYEPNAARTGCLPCPEGYAGRQGSCAACGNGTRPNAQVNCSNPVHNNADSCHAESGTCSDASLTTQATCLSYGKCCIVSVEGDTFETACNSPILESMCVLPDEIAVHGRGVLSRGEMVWTPLEWTPTNLWTSARAECERCTPYEYGPDMLPDGDIKRCLRCRRGYQVTFDGTSCERCPTGSVSEGGAVLRLAHRRNASSPCADATVAGTTIEGTASWENLVWGSPVLFPLSPLGEDHNTTGTGVIKFRLTASARPSVTVSMSMTDDEGHVWEPQAAVTLCPNGSCPIHAFLPQFSTGEITFVIPKDYQYRDAHEPQLQIVAISLTALPRYETAACPPWDDTCDKLYISAFHQWPMRADAINLAVDPQLAWVSSESGLGIRSGKSSQVEGINYLKGMACTQCRAGTQPDEFMGATECQTCSGWGLGYHSSDGLACILCPTGKTPKLDRSSCNLCPSTDIGVEGICYHCESGKYPTESQGSCRACPPAHIGYDGACSRCANGTMPDPTRTACLPCPVSWAGRNGFCNKCPQPPDSNATVPDMPFDGPYEGGKDCIRCVNQYSPDGIRCHTCPWGQEVNKVENGCAICPFGKVSRDGVRCVKCQPGEEVENPIDYSFNPPLLKNTTETDSGTEGCRDCLLRGRGYFSTDGLECKICPAGYTPSTDRSRCIPCSLGTERSGDPSELADKLCTVCPDGQWAWGRVSCEYCAENQAGRNGLCADCPSGKHPSPDHSFCEACPLGRAGRKGICGICWAGTIADLASVSDFDLGRGYGAQSCIRCADAHYADAGKCHLCESGKEPTTNESACEDCPAGRAGVDGVCTSCRPTYDTPVGVRGEIPNGARTDCIYTPATICGPLSREYADNQTIDMIKELDKINVAAKAWRVLPLLIVLLLTLLGLYSVYQAIQWLHHRRVFGKIQPLKSTLGESPYPSFWVRLFRWIRNILYLVVTCQCGLLCHKLRVFCLPPTRTPAPEPPEVPEELPEFEMAELSEDDTPAEPESAAEPMVAGIHEAEEPNAGESFEYQEHEAEEYEVDW